MGKWTQNSLAVLVNIQESTVLWKQDFGTPMGLFQVKCLLTSEHRCLESQHTLSEKGSWELGDMKFAGSNYQLYISTVVQSERSYY